MTTLQRWLAMLLVGALWALPGWAQEFETRLENGMKVVVKVDRRAPVVVSQLWYRAGSIDETNGTTGVAHVLEHMMFKGTRDVPEGEFSRRIAAVGGRDNAFTARDNTVYFQTLPNHRLQLAMQLEADRMANLALNEDAFAREIEVVKEERRLRTDDNPRARLYELLMATAFVAHPYRQPIIGWMNDLEHMTMQDTQDWYDRWYAPNNAALVVAGNVEPEQVFAWARQYFGPIPARPLPARKPQTEPQQMGERRVLLKAPAKLPVLAMAWPVPRITALSPTDDPARAEWQPYALEVLAGVLDGHASARLNQSLVRDRRLATEVGVGYDPVSRGPAQFLIEASPVQGQNLVELEAAIKAELARVAREGVSPAELARARAQVVAAQVFQQDSLFFQAMRIGEWITAGLDYRARHLRLERLQAVTSEQVQAVANQFFIDDRLTVAVLDPQPMPAGQPAARRGFAGDRHAR